mmetsp:Transcript_17875/g.17948  ORF Transcript_17875/g.17948 Transcript_17875/m.17948 type:complete len:319 (+) Transcript_17875:171-1127(+)|eukprot:CAMPEP_0182433514 /NCGR_PEP_ID=MMETSP1167-20130531/63731_1 /TAXON_ID=2988 /ORGANISM="Mallomonas Sp, Strain CCMP3275" /LENGTH=318 /DNA_ID=CAMNT_0024622307 /DNA_START=175 /DNA_END=1131 /DNA_ORIENTATION=-
MFLISLSAIICSPRTIYTTALSASTKSLSTKASCVSPIIAAKEALNFMGKAKFLDGSWGLDKTRDHFKEFKEGRIPGSAWFDLDDISDHSSPLPHMLPSAQYFSQRVSELGISSSDHIIVYVQPDVFSAARVWWTFRVFGHSRVSILDGGLSAWKREGGEVETGEWEKPAMGNFAAELDSRFVVDVNDVLKVVEDGSAQILDTRSSGRFLGTAPEPKPYLTGGHMPGALSLSHTLLTLPGDLTSYRPVEEMKKVLEETGVVYEGDSRVIATCGSGVTAATLVLAMHLQGKELKDVPIYDGSWSEWGDQRTRSDLPIIK